MRTWFRIILWVAGALGVVGALLYLLFFDVWTVPTDDPMLSASIEPTLSAGDVVIVTRHGSVDRGNLLRCADPQAPGRFVIARAIGRFGDHIEIHEEVVSIDSRRTPSPRACDPPSMTMHDPRTDQDVTLGCSVEDYGEREFECLRSGDHPEPVTKPAVVEAGKWYLVSDNRHVHLDSRDYGTIEPQSCQHVVFRVVGAGGFGDSRTRLNVIW
jgi:signal peptidase I